MNDKDILHTIKYIIIDALTILLSYVIIILLFFSLGIKVELNEIFWSLPFIIIIKIIIYYIFSVYKILTKHTGFEDVLKLLLLVISTNIILGLADHFIGIEFIDPVFLIFVSFFELLGLVTPRILRRSKDYFTEKIKILENLGTNTLIIGAGAAGEITIKELKRNKKINNVPIAILDDDPKKVGKYLMGIKVVGTLDDLEDVIVKHKIEEAIIAIKEIKKDKFNSLVDKLLQRHVKIKRLNVYEEINTSSSKTVLVDVNVEDLLNRDTIDLDNKEIAKFINNRVILITGGGGSIGSELSRQIFNLSPKELIIFDIYENNAYDIQMELSRLAKKNSKVSYPKLTVRIGSVYNYNRLEEIFKEFKPEIVFHAAAYKHVPLMEDSAVEAFRTNVIGTKNSAELSKKYGALKFVLVSSDKAVRPINIMGATKRLAEIIINECHEDGKTSFSAVRFGNVLDSNGSVVPLFKKQISDGGPVTVTHKDITRYFMTIPEAVGLILQCAVYAKDGELFILDMGEPVKIYDLAEKMIKLAGLIPNNDVDIEIVGLRPGEKLYEELLINPDDEHLNETLNKLIFFEKLKPKYEKEAYKELLNNFNDLTNDEIKEKLAKIVLTYKPDN